MAHLLLRFFDQSLHAFSWRSRAFPVCFRRSCSSSPYKEATLAQDPAVGSYSSGEKDHGFTADRSKLKPLGSREVFLRKVAARHRGEPRFMFEY
jgi:hypothetical protein